jgi:dTDP-4-amino-4,6-dideoxygalactose transaminase
VRPPLGRRHERYAAVEGVEDVSPAWAVTQEPLDERVPVARPQLPSTEHLLPYLRRIDETRVYTNWGPLSFELEARLSEHLRLPLGGMTSASSGTSALIGAILATAGRASHRRPLAVLPAFTFPASAAAAERCGYRPYLADIEADGWMLDPERLADHPALRRVGLVVPVAPFGRPVRQAPWHAFRELTQIPVVIDGAATFDRVSEDPAPHLGDIPVVMSFHATKCFATGEGGAVASTDTKVVERAAQALNFGYWGTQESRSSSINGKMSEYHAAVGLAELVGWPKKHCALQGVADRYRHRLAECGLSGRVVATPSISATYVLFRCPDAAASLRVQDSLRRFRVGHRLWYGWGLQHHSAFADVPHDNLRVTEDIAPCLIGIPVAPDLSDATTAYVVGALKDGMRRAVSGSSQL